jgi:AcrR family transcriptional regulator
MSDVEPSGHAADDAAPAQSDELEPARLALMRAATEVIGAEGWRSVSAAAIGLRAGVEPMLVRHHIDSVPALGREAAWQAIQGAFLSSASDLLNADSLLTGLERAVGAEADRSAREVQTILEATAASGADVVLAQRVRETTADFVALLAGRISEAQGNGEIRADLDAVTLALLIRALLDGLVLHRLLDPSYRLDRASDLLRAMLEPEPTVARAETSPSGRHVAPR